MTSSLKCDVFPLFAADNAALFVESKSTKAEQHYIVFSYNRRLRKVTSHAKCEVFPLFAADDAALFVRRDALWMCPLYRERGLAVGNAVALLHSVGSIVRTPPGLLIVLLH